MNNNYSDASVMSFRGLQLRSRDLIICVALLCWAVFGSMLIHVNTLYALSNESGPNNATTGATNIPVGESINAPASGTPSNGPAAAAAATIPAPQQCSKSPYVQPSQVPIPASQSGLIQVIDAPRYYQVYGHTPDQVLQQISRCTPLGNYAGVTDFALSWKYNYGSADGVCRVSSAAVSLHVSQTLPQWQSTPYASPGYASRWQAFIGNLRHHENGHTDLNVKYANKILNDLRALSAAPCSELQSIATNMVNANVAELNRAHDSYDDRTGHGATQGATIPRS